MDLQWQNIGIKFIQSWYLKVLGLSVEALTIILLCVAFILCVCVGCLLMRWIVPKQYKEITHWVDGRHDDFINQTFSGLYYSAEMSRLKYGAGLIFIALIGLIPMAVLCFILYLLFHFCTNK